MRHLFLAAALAVGSLVSTSIAAPDSDWPGHMGPHRDNRSADTGLIHQWPAEGPKQLWKVENLGPGWSSIAVAGGSIYTTGNEGENQMLLCLDLDGKEKWRVAQGPKSTHKNYFGARATPTVDADRVYVTGAGGKVTCHSAKDGKIIWAREMKKEMGGEVGGWQYAESVLFIGDHAIVTPGGKNAIVALDKMTGKDVWKSDVSAGANYSSCIAITEGGDTIIVNGSKAGLLAVDAKTGAKVWSNPFAANNTANTPTPAYSDGKLFWAVGYGKGAICFDVSHKDGQWSFKEAWTNNDLTVHPGNYVIDKGLIFGKGKGGVVCVDLKTGQKKWSVDVKGGSLTMADGLLFGFSDSGGTAWLVEPTADAGKVLGTFKVAGTGNSWAYPVVTGGRLYLRYDTNLYCFDVKGK
jgi:outer membrane protein assembly factor BamB